MLLKLPAQAPNMHWTRSLAASPQGLLYVGIGSNSNIGENGLESEAIRAATGDMASSRTVWAIRFGPASRTARFITPAVGADSAT